ncbi:MAG: acyl-[acyl-carrier-protein]--UDP-N-acetylglucosamine O-acyltransferase, partial [Gemmatimonadaceae bacterium]
SGLTAAHQFVRIGRHSFIGGMSRVSKDIPPFLKAVGNPVKLYGLNTVGLQRNGLDEPTIRELKRAYRLLFRSDLNVTQAIERAQDELDPLPEVKELLRFVEASERGVVI